MRTELSVSIIHIFTILSIGIVGITVLITVMVTDHRGQCLGVWDGVTPVMVGDILVTDGVIPVTVGDTPVIATVVAVITPAMVVATILATHQILTVILTDKEDLLEQL